MYDIDVVLQSNNKGMYACHAGLCGCFLSDYSIPYSVTDFLNRLKWPTLQERRHIS